MAKKRVVFNPEFEEQIDRDEEIRDTIAKETGMSYEQAYKKYKNWCGRISKRVGNERTKRMSHNVGNFFAFLYAGLYGGEVRRANYGYSGFHADVVDEGDNKVIETEVKATSRKNGSPKLACCQFANAFGEFYRLVQSGTETVGINYAIFQYGKGHNSLGLAKYDNNGLAKVLSQNVKTLLIVPLNVLIPMIMAHKFTSLNHGSSDTHRNEEHYSLPRGKLITDINNSHDAVEELFKSAKKQGFSSSDLCLEGLVREDSMSPDNLFCRQHKVLPFKITQYSNSDPDKWANAFVGKNNNGVCHRILEYFYISPDLFISQKQKPDDDNTPF